MTKVPTAIFRFDASPTIGGGHAVRSGALAAALAWEGWYTICATRSETIDTTPATIASFNDVIRLTGRESEEIEEIGARVGASCEAVVIDHYGRGRTLDRECRRIAPCVTVIEDRPQVDHDCDVLVNQSIAPDEVTPGAGLRDQLIGPRYALLRPTFLEARLRNGGGHEAGHVLLLCGYTDKPNLTERLFDALDGTPGVRSIHVVIGSSNRHRERLRHRLRHAVVPACLHVEPPSMADLMVRASLAVTTAGSTCWELACLGVPMVTVVAAANQAPVARTLRMAGASESAGKVNDSIDETVRAMVVKLISDGDARRRMASHCRDLVDGRGAARVARVIGGRVRPNWRSMT